MCGSWFFGSPFGGMMSGFGRGGMLLSLLFGLGILVLVVLLVVILVRKNRTTGGSQLESRAKQILDERYACGEITQEQYQMMMKDIR